MGSRHGFFCRGVYYWIGRYAHCHRLSGEGQRSCSMVSAFRWRVV